MGESTDGEKRSKRVGGRVRGGIGARGGRRLSVARRTGRPSASLVPTRAGPPRIFNERVNRWINECMKGRKGRGKIGELLRKKRAREAWGAEGSWAYRLGSRRVLGRAWALWFQAVGSKIQVDTGGRCLSLGRAGTLLGGTGQAKQPLGGRSDPGQWTKSSASEDQAGYRQGAQGLGWVSALSFLLAGSRPC